MERRFVIQIHRGWGPTHFDLMVEQSGSLATWQFSSSPASVPRGERRTCRRIADHRLTYLTYEGAVSGGRGEVEILDAGRCKVSEAGEERWILSFAGERLTGEAELRRGDGADRWVFVRPGP